jgi:hypothetical protein
LLFAGVEDRGAIAAAHVVALAIAGARVVDLEEELENLPIAHAGRIEDDLHCFGMPAMVAVRSVASGAAGVPHARRQNAVVAAQEVLHAPETAARKNRAFFAHQAFSSGFR